MTKRTKDYRPLSPLAQALNAEAQAEQAKAPKPPVMFKGDPTIAIPEWLQGEHWIDNSSHNDAMPHMDYYTTPRAERTIDEMYPAFAVWVDADDPAQREMGGWKYMISVYEDNGPLPEQKELCASDDPAVIQKAMTDYLTSLSANDPDGPDGPEAQPEQAPNPTPVKQLKGDGMGGVNVYDLSRPAVKGDGPFCVATNIAFEEVSDEWERYVAERTQATA